jgi:hypothetical protein
MKGKSLLFLLIVGNMNFAFSDCFQGLVVHKIHVEIIGEKRDHGKPILMIYEST